MMRTVFRIVCSGCIVNYHNAEFTANLFNIPLNYHFLNIFIFIPFKKISIRVYIFSFNKFFIIFNRNCFSILPSSSFYNFSIYCLFVIGTVWSNSLTITYWFRRMNSFLFIICRQITYSVISSPRLSSSIKFLNFLSLFKSLNRVF
jgi:hypothetical protein